MLVITIEGVRRSAYGLISWFCPFTVLLTADTITSGSGMPRSAYRSNIKVSEFLAIDMTSVLPILSYPAADAGPDLDSSLVMTAVQQSRADAKIVGKKADVEAMSQPSPRGLKKTGKKKRSSVRKGEEKRELSAKQRSALKAKALSRVMQDVKRAVLEVQLVLLDGVKDKAQLRSAIPLLTQAEYSDVVLERSFVQQCGYPLCQKGLEAETTRKGRYRISLREHKVYDLSETFLFCHVDCLIASKTFQSELQAQRGEIVGKDKLLSIVHSVRNANIVKASKVNKTFGEYPDTIELKVRSNESVVSSVRERDEHHDVSSFDSVGPFDAIEGYVPRNAGRHRQQQNTAGKSESAKSCNKEDLGDLGSGDVKEGDTNKVRDAEPVSLDRCQDSFAPVEVEADKSVASPLKSILKKGTSPARTKRSVSWGDRQKRDRKEERTGQKQASAAVTNRPIVEGPADSASTACPSTEVRASDTCTPITGSSVQSTEKIDALREHEDTGDGRRFLAAEEIAVALVEAADAVAGGEVGSAEAVAKAGLSIVPGADDVTKNMAVSTEGCGDGTKSTTYSCPITAELVDGREKEVEQDDGSEADLATTARGAWYDTPPKDFKVEVSMFGTIWTALEEWISAATIAYFYGREPQNQEEFVVANGREYSRHVHFADSTSTGISNMVSTCLSTALPHVVEELRLNVPVSVLGQTLGRLVRTMTFVESLPPFSTAQWNLISMLLVVGLSAQRLPAVGVHLDANLPLLLKFLDSVGIDEAEYDTFKGLLLPFGQLPDVSTPQSVH